MNNSDSIIVSPQTLEKMRTELEELTGPKRDEMAERLQRARELGDLKENAEYHSAKDAQGLMEARIRHLQNTIRKAVVQERTDSDEVGVGLIVTVDDGDDQEDYLFAHSAEEKVPGAMTITPSSPMGNALAGKKVGDEVLIEAPNGSFRVKISALRPAE